MALILTTFLHSGFSEVSVSFLFISASSSGVSLTVWFCSSPQKHITAFLHRPGCSSGSVTEEWKVMKMLWCRRSQCIYVCQDSACYQLCPKSWNIVGYQPNRPFRGPPSPLYDASGSKPVDITGKRKGFFTVTHDGERGSVSDLS